jgi:hypothetical protein
VATAFAGVALVGCGGGGKDFSARYREPVAEIDGHVLDASVVEMIAERDELDEDAAKEKALETLRLAVAYEQARKEESAEFELIDPARETHLLRSARARLWLEEDFEPKHTPADIPADVIAANMNKRGVFHPEIYAICNAIVMPAEMDDENGRHALPPDDPQWWARAEEYMKPIEAALRQYIPDPGQEPNCKFFGKVARLAAPESDDLYLKIEQGGFAACKKDRWDPGFVDALCGQKETGWIDGFRTQFGVHFVALLKIDPANEPDDEGKKAYLRERMHAPWQQEAFGEYMERLRAKRTVRYAAGVQESEGAAGPRPSPKPGAP